MKLLIVLIILGILLISGLFFLQKEKSGSIPIFSSAVDYSAPEDLAFWIGAMNKNDASISYKQFVDNNSNSPFEIRHVRAHVMGEALFEVVGVSGISICDSNFGFGCFHGLFTVGFSSKGKSFVKEADALCVERYGVLGTGCQHGIGHGIVEYVGRQRLNEALELCDETSQPTPLLGCTSGVFMERNTPFTVLPDAEQLEPYPYSEESPYASCEQVPIKYQVSCYYELGGWWEVVLQSDKSKMGELCARISDKKLRDSCALGVGNIIGPTNGYDVERSSLICSRMPKSIETLCYAGVAWSLFSNPEHSEKAVQMCEGLEESEAQICNNSYNLADDVPGLYTQGNEND